jgi:N-acetylglutamate synthase-like GNAT family acetyltransferase
MAKTEGRGLPAFPDIVRLGRLLGLETVTLNSRLRCVSSVKYRVRRATLDDIGQLSAVWDSMQYPTSDLAKRVTEFQVAVSADGVVVGAVGLQLAERQGLVHSEAFSDFSLAEQLRPLLWDRIQNVATNQGLLRIWTQEQAPFWNHCGMAKADEEALHKLPAAWRGPSSTWRTLKLRDEAETLMSADKEFALFMQAEKQRTEQVIRRAKTLKNVMTLLAFALLILVVAWAIRMFMRHPQLLPR